MLNWINSPRQRRLRFAVIHPRAAMKAWVSGALALVSLDQYERSGALADLEKAISLCRDSLAVIPQRHPGRADHLANLATALRYQFNVTGDLAYLEESLAADRQALEAIPDGHPGHASHLNNLGIGLAKRFERTGELPDLNEAIAVGRQAVAGADAPRDRSSHLYNLGTALLSRFERTGEPGDLDEAVELTREALSKVSASHNARAMYLAGFAAMLVSRFRHTGQLSDLEEAIVAGREAVAATPGAGPGRAAPLNTLGNAMLSRFERFGELADLDEAVSSYREAAAIAADQPRQAVFLKNLTTALNDRFRRTGESADLEHAIAACREAVAATPSSHPDRPDRIDSLALALGMRFERTGNLADLEEAIALGRQAVTDAPDDHPDQARYFNNLSIHLRLRFRRTGNLADQDEAVSLGRQAVSATREADTARANHLNTLASALCERFMRTGQASDLEEGITISRQAVTATPADHPWRTQRLSNLGYYLHRRFERTGNLADLEEAIALGRQAVTATPEDLPERSTRIGNIGRALQSMFERTGNLADLDEAVVLSRQALAATREDHPDHAARQNSLSIRLRSRFGRTGNLADLDEAIVLSREAVANIPDDHPYLASFLNNLGNALQQRREGDGQASHPAEATEVFKRAAFLATARPIDRIWASRYWARAAAGAGDWAQAMEGFSLAVRLLPQVTSRNLGRTDAEHGLSQLSGLAAEAAACALQISDPPQAVQLLEQGRGILLAQTIETRSDVSALRRIAPHLAERFLRLRDRLDAPRANILPEGEAEEAWYAEPTAALARLADERRAVAAEWDQLIAEIRTQPGLADFLEPPALADLLAEASSGPLVLINVSDYRSDALILTADRIDVEPLPGLRPSRVREEVRRLFSALASARVSRNTAVERQHAQQVITSILGWLWDVLAGPVLDRLNLTAQPQDKQAWQRIWWSPGGLLCFLPVHAAGHHDELDHPNPRTVLDRVISSYTPTVRALHHARSREQATAAAVDRMLAVAMPHTPGAPDLPGAQPESDLLSRMFGARVLTDAEATYETVLAEMQACQCVHFSCHGVGHWDNPSASRLLLHDHMNRPLAVSDISRLNLAGSRLAFLAACNTSRGNLELADESIHITGAFQLAGYASVIGTLWPVNDAIAARIAETFYEEIARTSSPRIDVAEAASALHVTIRSARSRYRGSPTLWAGHVHVGA